MQNGLVALFVFLFLAPPVVSQVRITPSAPPGVGAGACVQFKANYPGTWTVACQGAGCQAGSIDADGRYCAPATVRAKNQSRGCQLAPNDNVYNVPINKLPVSPFSARWLGRIASENDGGNASFIYHRFHIPSPGTLNMYDNVVDNATPTQKRHFVYDGPWQDTAFAQPLPPSVEMENAWSQDVNAGLDRYQFAINRQTCDDQEIYNDYVDFKSFSFSKGNPTTVKFTTDTIRPIQNPVRVYVSGAGDSCGINGPQMAKVISPSELQIPVDTSHCSLFGAQIAGSAAGCPKCNSGGGVHWPVTSNAILYGADAAGAPISRTSVHVQEWWNAVQKHILDPACNCVTIGHSLAITLTNADIAPADLWPSISGHAVTGGHPQLQPIRISDSNPVTFVVPADNCDGKSYLQCSKPCDNWTFTIGCQFHVVFGGGTGPWAALNGKHYLAQATGNDSFKIPVNAAKSGGMPAGLYYYFDWAPYGTRFRLKSSFNVAAFCNDDSLASKCPYEKAILNTLQVYGLVLIDGTIPADNWDSGLVSDEFFPDQLVDAMADMNQNPALGFNPKWPAGGAFEQYLEIVDESGLQVSNDPQSLGLTNDGRVTVTITTSGHGSASMDVSLLGTTVGVDRSRIAIAAKAGNTYQIDAWVNGNADPGVNYTMSPPVAGASVSSAGVVKPPPSLTEMKKTTVTACSKAASEQCAYVDVFFIPVSPDGSIRLWFGGRQPSYKDRSGNVWWGQLKPRNFGASYENADGINFASLDGTWESAARNWSDPDAQLYAQSTASQNDTLLNIAVPNGSYSVTFYGEAGYGTKKAGEDVFDLELDGQVVASYLDGFVLAGGPFKGWTKRFDASVSNGVLEAGGRIRESSVYGISLSSLLITPAKAH